MDGYQRFAPSQMEKIARRFADMMRRRKSVRDFSNDTIPQDVIRECLRAATSAPSIEHRQPWRFVAISDSGIKSQIRASEIATCPHAAKDDDQHLAFLEKAPWLIAVFSEPNSSACASLAIGLLLTSIHSVGLGSMIYSPGGLDRLNAICNRPRNEKPVMIIAIGHPKSVIGIPQTEKSYKELDQVIEFLD